MIEDLLGINLTKTIQQSQLSLTLTKKILVINKKFSDVIASILNLSLS